MSRVQHPTAEAFMSENQRGVRDATNGLPVLAGLPDSCWE